MKRSYLISIAFFGLAASALGCNLDVESAKEVAQDVAQEVLDVQTEVRQIEDVEIRPRLDELQRLQDEEIHPREELIDDLRQQLRNLERDVIRPLEEQLRMGPGADRADRDAQVKYEELFRELMEEERAIDGEFQRMGREFQDNERVSRSGQDGEIRELETERQMLGRQLEEFHRYAGLEMDRMYQEVAMLEEQRNYPPDSPEYATLNEEIDAAYDQIGSFEDQQYAEIAGIEKRLTTIDDELQELWWNSEDQYAAAQQKFDKTMMALEDRRYQLQEKRWRLEEEAEKARVLAETRLDDAFREAEENITAVYEKQFMPLEEQIFQLEDELDGLRNHARSLARELGAVRTRVEPMEAGIEDHLLGLLQAAIISVTADDEAAEPAPAP